MQLKTGVKGLLSHNVTGMDLATNWQNDIPVLATPILLWLAELASMRAIDNCLEPGDMTLGRGHSVEHLAPTPEGWNVMVEAELSAIDGRILTFEVQASDGKDVVLVGKHTRAIVNRQRFTNRLASKIDTVALYG